MAEHESQERNEDPNGDSISVGDLTNNKAVAIGRGATAVYQGLSIEEVASLVIELKNKDQPTVWDGRIPYLGLAAFHESDAQFFFGREGLIDDLLNLAKSSNFIVIAGPSGSGKSSVARAGLFHALRSSRLEHSASWLLATMQPKNNPIDECASAIGRLAQSPTAGDYVRKHGKTNPRALHEQLETLLTDDPRQRCVLLVDQFEEIFTQTKDEEVRTAFINMLTNTAEIDVSRVIIVICLRADFVSNCAHYPSLRKLISQQFHLVGAMEPQELAKAITLPALEVGVDIDPALVSQIMTDMKGEPGALPLMSFALRDLFEAGKNKKGEPMDMILSKYVQRGGIGNALEHHANKVFTSFSKNQKQLAKSVFSKLIEVGKGHVDTRRTAIFTDLIPTGTDADEVAKVVDTLASGGVRLLVTDSNPASEADAPQIKTVTIAHEKLIDAWPWLRQLVNDNRELIALQNQIDTDAQLWVKERDVGYLYRGSRLMLVEEKLAKTQLSLNESSEQFIQASLKAKEIQHLSAEELQNQIEDQTSHFQELEEIKSKNFIIPHTWMKLSHREIISAMRKRAVQQKEGISPQIIMVVGFFLSIILGCASSFFLLGLSSLIENAALATLVQMLSCPSFSLGLVLTMIIFGIYIPLLIKPEIDKQIQIHRKKIDELEQALTQIK